jgi:hypothetical protein
MSRFALLGLVLCACNGPAIPDGGVACSIDADCPDNFACNCPVDYKNCVNGFCSTTCPVEQATPAGQPCGAGCECQSGVCGVDTETCCAAGGAASGTNCQHDCDCISAICSGNACM